MKANKILKGLAILLTAITISGSTMWLPVSAGVSESVIDSTTIGDELDKSVWANPSGDVITQAGTIIFPKESTEETRLITKSMARVDESLEKVASVKANVQLTNIPEGKAFIIAFGLNNVEAMPGDSGSIEIRFQKKGSLQVAVIANTKDGEAVELSGYKNLATTKKVNVEATLNVGGKIVVSVNGKQVCNATSPVDGEGRIGFLQTGACEVKISDIEIATCKYDTPKNCDVFEDFENGTMNRNSLLSSMTINNAKFNPSQLCIQEYDGNQVLMWENIKAGYIGTKYKYSNFEISFDVPYLARTNEVDQDGNVIKGKSEGIGIAYGCEAAECTSWGYQTATDMVLIRTNSKVESVSNGKFTSGETMYPVFDAEKGKAFSVKVNMTDSVITVYLKWMDETKYTKVLSYQLTKETPTGYIQIWATGSGNFAIDNLKIVNTDKNPQLEDVAYESAKIERIADFEYEPMKNVYAEIGEESFNWFVLLPIVTGVCLVTLASLVVIKKVIQGKRKDGVMNEK